MSTMPFCSHGGTTTTNMRCVRIREPAAQVHFEFADHRAASQRRDDIVECVDGCLLQLIITDKRALPATEEHCEQARQLQAKRVRRRHRWRIVLAERLKHPGSDIVRAAFAHRGPFPSRSSAAFAASSASLCTAPASVIAWGGLSPTGQPSRWRVRSPSASSVWSCSRTTCVG